MAEIQTRRHQLLLFTVTLAEPRAARKLASTTAVSGLAFTTVVGKLVLFQITVEALEKLDPFSVSVMVAAPAKADWGVRDERLGTSL